MIIEENVITKFWKITFYHQQFNKISKGNFLAGHLWNAPNLLYGATQDCQTTVQKMLWPVNAWRLENCITLVSSEHVIWVWYFFYQDMLLVWTNFFVFQLVKLLRTGWHAMFSLISVGMVCNREIAGSSQLSSFCFNYVDNSLAIWKSQTCYSQCPQTGATKAIHVLSCLRDNAR